MIGSFWRHVINPQYSNEGSGDFSKMTDILFDNNWPVATLYFDRSEYKPDCFGVVSSLETERKIVIPKRSGEVSSSKNMYTGFSGGTPYGLKKFDEWTKNRIKEESNQEPKVSKIIGLYSDNVSGCDALGYRSFVDRIENLPKNVKSPYGIIKYDEMLVLDKSELPSFIRENRDEIVSTFLPTLTLIAAEGQLEDMIKNEETISPRHL